MTEDYVTLYINTAFSVYDPLSFFSLMFLFFGRMMPIIALAPFFGARVLPHPVKVALTISLFAIFLPQLVFVTTTPITFNLLLVLYFFKELFVGILIGYMISLPFVIVQNSGILIDHQRGGSSLMVNDPTMQNQSSPLGTLFNLVLIYLFFMIDGPFMILDIISQSYSILPPDKFITAKFFTTDSNVVIDVMKIVGKVMILSTQLAAPALIMILMTDFFLGVANRLAPQVQITFLGMPLKSLLALAIVFFGWQLFIKQMINESYTWINYLYKLIDQFQPAA
ncbi:type III secretion inner membrane protein SctT [Candidatus Protochlamydia naegleriophila]|uniref:Type III secretion inner membrane protein SctT n=1 Tax=Candidatus Protochlamydia naegleriophila TaxID=389348 RepID=A0A0U5JBT6_9BACT|nr:flagellar biosynthetic protein FliR [Candidatus Protochlamydia naegleriophila]CUI15839.1 type III secretion inner membrane protein SctT [Candidatus Protochlamydia naegleriophila]